MTFNELNLSEPLLKAIEGMGFETPTPIQEQTIPILISGTQDYVGLAQTGTGKTAAFSLPLLELVQVKKGIPQALVLAPTRELGMQITADIQNYSKYVKGLSVVAVYGGSDINKQIRDIKKGVQIVVATPGRLIDLAKRKAINLSKIEYIVLDEADEMLNMGFKEDLDTILTFVENRKSTWLFSATMPPEVRRIASEYMNNPQEVTVGKKNTTNENIEHKYYLIEHRDRDKALKRLLDYYPHIYGIVFCRTRIETKKVAENLMNSGYNADALHGDLSQAQRDLVMKKFKSKHLNILVATDVAARGIDVDDITHVINYNLPDDLEVYTHRSGRTARAGKKGMSLILIGQKDSRKLKDLKKIITQNLSQDIIPTPQNICENQLLYFAENLAGTEINKDVQPFLDDFQAQFKDFSKEEILAKIATQNFNKLLSYYKNASHLKEGKLSKSGRMRDDRRDDRRDARTNPKKKQERIRSKGGERFFINLGAKDKMRQHELKDFLIHKAGVPENAFGKVEMKDSFSFFEIYQEGVKKIKQAKKKKLIHDGRKIRIEVAEAKKK